MTNILSRVKNRQRHTQNLERRHANRLRSGIWRFNLKISKLRGTRHANEYNKKNAHSIHSIKRRWFGTRPGVTGFGCTDCPTFFLHVLVSQLSHSNTPAPTPPTLNLGWWLVKMRSRSIGLTGWWVVKMRSCPAPISPHSFYMFWLVNSLIQNEI